MITHDVYQRGQLVASHSTPEAAWNHATQICMAWKKHTISGLSTVRDTTIVRSDKPAPSYAGGHYA